MTEKNIEDDILTEEEFNQKLEDAFKEVLEEHNIQAPKQKRIKRLKKYLKNHLLKDKFKKFELHERTIWQIEEILIYEDIDMDIEQFLEFLIDIQYNILSPHWDKYKKADTKELEGVWFNNKECPQCGKPLEDHSIRACETGYSYCSNECASTHVNETYEEAIEIPLDPDDIKFTTKYHYQRGGKNIEEFYLKKCPICGFYEPNCQCKLHTPHPIKQKLCSFKCKIYYDLSLFFRKIRNYFSSLSENLYDKALEGYDDVF